MPDPTESAAIETAGPIADETAAAEPIANKTDAAETDAREPQEGLLLDELLIEDVSIDGMCGVY